ncbi:MAG: acyl-CoA thioesterase [Vulcanimicrobiaceae bacterium]
MKFRDSMPAGARTFETRVRVQWADIDAARICYFVAYWRFIEGAEMEFFRELGFAYDAIFERFDIWLPRVNVEAQYYAPALIDDWLRLRTHIIRVGASSITWQTVVFNERTGEAGAVFTLTVACMERTSKKGCPLPAELRAALLTCVAAG